MKLLNLGCGQRYHSDWVNIDYYSSGPNVMPYDLQNGIPFPDDSFDVVYQSHLLEHFSKNRAQFLLQECFRVLKPGGTIRVVVPDLEQIARIYLELIEKALQGNRDAATKYNWIVLEMFDQMVRNRPGGEMLEYWKKNPMPAEDFVIERIGTDALGNLATLRDMEEKPDIDSGQDPIKIGLFRLSGEVHQWMHDRYSLFVWLKDAGFRDVRQCKADESAIPEFNGYLLDIEENGRVRKPDSLFMEGTKPLIPETLHKNRPELERQRAQSTDAAAAADSLWHQLDYLREQFGLHEVSWSSVLAKLRESEAGRSDLEAKLRETEAGYSDLEAKLRETEAGYSDLEAKLRETEVDRTAKTEMVENLCARIQANVDLIAKQAGEVGRLSAEVRKQEEELMQKRATISNIHASLSWRITRPLRAFQGYATNRPRNQRNNISSHDDVVPTTEALPLVSIVTPVYNGARWLEECIGSVLQQDYPRIEHIIVDGGSKDGTLEICAKYPHLIVHSKKDRGQSHAINKGFAIARGHILAWLCADDEYEPGAVSAAVKCIRSGQSVVMGYSRFTDAGGNVISDHPANPFPYYSYGMFLRFWRYNPVSQPAIFWTREMWETCGPLRENLYFAMDYDLWLRMSRKVRFERIHTYIARYRIHPDAKCFADNYGSRVELINVSRQYWPSAWMPGHWLLYLQYKASLDAITQHYADAENLLDSAVKLMKNGRRFDALISFVRAHVKHLATPLMPGYAATVKQMLGEGLSAVKVAGLLRKAWDLITMQQKVSIRIVNADEREGSLILKAESQGYRDPEFKFWAKKGDDFVLLRDWGAEPSCVLSAEHAGIKEFGVHIRSKGGRDMKDQAWVKAA